MTWQIFIFLVLSLKIDWSTGACPPKEVVSPCHCGKISIQNHYQIYCNNSVTKTTFKRIADSRKPNDRHFYNLWLSKLSNEEIEADLIGNLTFEFISIVDSSRLRRIHSKAFANTASRLNSFYLTNLTGLSVNSPAPYNFFDMINSFANIEILEFKTVNIRHLPSQMFKQLPKLKRFTFRGPLTNKTLNYRLSIGDRAFYNLENITKLDLTRQQINYLPPTAFEFRRDSNQILQLTFTDNNLNSSSFSSGWLNNINRPVNVDLLRNEVSFLDRIVFEPFLNGKRINRIDVARNRLNCSDCRNAWLKKEKNKFKTLVSNAYCEKMGRSIFDSNFEHCP